jgi:hypothetical protein
LGAPVWEHHPQIEDGMLTAPYSTDGPSDDYLETADGDALIVSSACHNSQIANLSLLCPVHDRLTSRFLVGEGIDCGSSVSRRAGEYVRERSSPDAGSRVAAVSHKALRIYRSCH